MPNETGNKWGSWAVPSPASILNFKPVQATEPEEFSCAISKMPYIWWPFLFLFPSPRVKNTVLPNLSHTPDCSGKESHLNAFFISSYSFISCL